MKPRVEELESTLSTLEPGVPMRWSNVSWQDYEDYLKIIGDRQYRTSYGDGGVRNLTPMVSSRNSDNHRHANDSDVDTGAGLNRLEAWA